MKSLFRIIVTLYLALFCVDYTLAQVQKVCYVADQGASPRAHNVNFLTLSLDVKFEPENKKVIGEVTHTFTPLQAKVDTVFLDAIDINITSVTMNGNTLKYKLYPNGVAIYFNDVLQLDEQYSITINYTATPTQGIYFIGWDDPKNKSRKQIWTQGQGTDNRHWIPMYDTKNDKIVSDVTVTFNSAYKVLSNGELVDKNKRRNATTTWHYAMQEPHTTYLIMIAIGKYDILELEAESGESLLMYYYPEWEKRVPYTYKYMEDMFNFFENEIGVPYAWKTDYSQIPVQGFLYGAMENTTATVFGDFYFVDRRAFYDKNYIGVNAHELAHQWFGDLVTARSSAHHWLQESFATFYSMVFKKQIYGVDYYAYQRRQNAHSAFRATKRNNYPIACSFAGNARWYPKGANVLHMLRYVVGRDAYNRAVKNYLQLHKYQNVDTEDLLTSFHETLGYDLSWFWQEWLYHGGEPEYTVRIEQIPAESSSKTRFYVNQTHETSAIVTLFKMPFWFEVHYKDGSKDSVKAWIEEKNEIVDIPNPNNKEIAYTLFDPNSMVMKTVNFEKPIEALKAQAKNAAGLLDRYDAWVQLRSASSEEKFDLMKTCYAQETHFYTKGEILKQAVSAVSAYPDMRQIIMMGLKDSNIRSRKILLGELNLIDEEQAHILYSYFSEPDASYNLLKKTLELLVYNYPKQTNKWLSACDELQGVRGRSFRIKWLTLACSFTSTTKWYFQELERYTGISYEFVTRRNAMIALQKLDYLNKNIIANILNAIMDENGRLSGPASQTLQAYYAIPEFAYMIKKYLQTANISPATLKKAKHILNIS